MLLMTLSEKGLAVEVDYSLPTLRVIQTLNDLIEYLGKPISIRCDNGPKFISHDFTWCTSGRSS